MAKAASITIRPLAEEDEDDWRKLWRAYLDFYETSLPDEVYASSFARMLSNAEGEFRGLIAVADDRPVGLAHYLFHRTGWAIEDTCYLQDLYTAPAVRGTGIGRRLIEAVYEAADRHGAGGVYWLTQDFNTTARQLYDRIGLLTPFIKYRRV